MPPLYQAVVDAALADGLNLMTQLLQATHRGLHERYTLATTHQASQTLKQAEQFLGQHEKVMVERFPSALKSALLTVKSPLASRSVASVQFDQLELMDEAQVLEQVALARVQQVVLPVVEQSFATLVLLMSSVPGSTPIPVNQNPLRPDIYIRALLTTVNQMRLPTAVHQEWLTSMGVALGPVLSAQYIRLSSSLTHQGVKFGQSPLNPFHRGFSDSGLQQLGESSAPVPLIPLTGRAQSGDSQALPPQTVSNDSTLTLNRLRMLLSGELTPRAPATTMASFAQKFALEFDGLKEPSLDVETDFDVTVPAAFEELQEMKQVDHVMQRIGDRNAAGLLTPGSVAALNLSGARSRLTSRDLGQALSLEVVSLMIDNIVTGTHVLDPIKKIIGSLKPALLCLAETDPRFFSHKGHPARRLLQEITDRSVAYESIHHVGFNDFILSLQAAIAPVLKQPTGDPLLFEVAVERLILALDSVKQPEKMKKAVNALQRAEERHWEAMQIASAIRSRTDAAKVPEWVLDFLCGPWAQVIAHARMESRSDDKDPGKYRELVEALLWSARPELTRKEPAKLTRLLPKLLAKLRQGLNLIDYPPVQSSPFFSMLMGLHHMALRPSSRPTTPARVSAVVPAKAVERREADPWLAPNEAEASGFIALLPAAENLSPGMSSGPMRLTADSTDKALDQGVELLLDGEFSIGVWVEILSDKVWTRTQLTWTNPKATLFLFTSATGATQSMTRRSRDQMLLANTMRLVSGQHVLDDALNAVARAALRNSIDHLP